MTKKRKGLSKKTRFEVFKRDGFSCQYCGAKPPGVLLHVDHIEPVADGGGNDIDNLLTSCEPCNLGKGARSLSVVPQSLADKAAEVEEREAQLAGYHEILEAKRQRIERDVWRVLETIHGAGVSTVPRDEYSSVQRFVEHLGVHSCLEAAEIALGSGVPLYRVFKYFCGVCWNRVREA